MKSRGIWILIGCWLALIQGALPAVEWAASYPLALSRAKTERRPLCVLFREQNAGKVTGFVEPALEQALEGFVCVWFRDTSRGTRPARLGGADVFAPAFVFLDSESEQRLIPETPAKLTLPVLAKARAAGALPLTPEMLQLLAAGAAPQPDSTRLRELMNAGDVAGLMTYLTPFAETEASQVRYVIVKVAGPNGRAPARTTLQSSAHRAALDVPAPGVLVLTIPRTESAVRLTVSAPAHASLTQELQFQNVNLVSREFHLVSMAGSPGSNAGTSLQGVVQFRGQPVAGAMVKLTIKGVPQGGPFERTGPDGRFAFAEIQLGRAGAAEANLAAVAAGALAQRRVYLAAGRPVTLDLNLAAAATVKIRWAMQREPGNQELRGTNLVSGENTWAFHGRAAVVFGQTRNGPSGDALLEQFQVQAYHPDMRAETTRGGTAWKPTLSRTAQGLAEIPEGHPVWWMQEGKRGRSPGLHRESEQYDTIQAVNGAALTSPDYFEAMRGVPLVQGEVYTLRTASGQFAKAKVVELSTPRGPAGPGGH